MTRLLDSINSPADLKQLSPPQLKQLAAELREELVSVVEANGGHLASNLGAVELTIALHRVFSTPEDKIVWDTGHQSYVHKILTDRRERFATLRQYGGLSGFASREESPHDAFGVGHASTSISAALGIANARDLKGEGYHVVAVIGDGALTGGMALEALNQAGHLGSRLIVVLNDNGMAISPSVGALARLLGRVRLDRRYLRTKGALGRFVTRLPLGKRAWRTSKRAKESIKSFLLPTMMLEEIGFTYIGPFDGHDTGGLERALRQARSNGRPTFVHVVTQKGKGYPQAEEDAVGYHGLSPKGGCSKAPSYSEVFGNTLSRLFAADDRLIAITAAMLEGTGLSRLAKEFPQRVFDVGICEPHAVTFAAGLAAEGFVPIVAVYSTFLQRAFDQVMHDVCLQGLPVVFAVDRGGIVGEDGKTHQGCFDLSYLGCIPNLVISAPRDEVELQRLLFTATRAGRPFAIRYPRGACAGVDTCAELKELSIGRGELLREGDDLLLLAIGATVRPALDAAADLAARGIECAVMDARFAKPLDSALILEIAGRTGRVLTIEENSLAGGFGSAVLQLLRQGESGAVKAACLAIPDQFVEHGPQWLLRSKYSLDAAGIAAHALACFPELAAMPAPRAK